MQNPTELHEALARVVPADRQLGDVLTEITGIARRAMPSIEAASITLIRGEKPFTAAHDGQMALDADELQYERGYGPCMDAGRAGQMFLIDDMRSEQRWPEYARHAAAHGVLSEDLTQLRTAMMSRACIEQAKGILMERHKIKEDEAFTILTHASQRTNTKLRDVASELVRTGALLSARV